MPMTAMQAGRTSSLDNLIDAVIANAAECLRGRVFLRAVDWSAVRPAQVARLTQNLEAESVPLPAWLASALLASGHCLPASQLPTLGAALNALNSLNRLRRPGHDGDAHAEAAAATRDLVARDDIAPEVVAAAVKHLVGLGEGELAARVALAHWRTGPQLLRLAQPHLGLLRETLPAVRLRVTGVSNAQGLAANLPAAFAAAGYNASVSESEFGQAFPELLQVGEEDRDALIVLLDLDGLHARDWRQEKQADDALTRKLDLLASALETYASAGAGPVIINTVPYAHAPTAGLIDGRHPSGTAWAIAEINTRLQDVAQRHSQVLLVDAHGALGGIAPSKWIDPKLALYGRMPYAADATRHLAMAFARAFQSLKRGPAKVLALDLDNTVWGGIFGEDGVSKLLCDDEFPGNAFKAFQHECLRLKGQGMLLALLSKNNPDAITAFADHPGMLLKEDDFVAIRINWEPKAANIQSLAQELNLGLDSFVFLDDSPHERDAMRRVLPDVIVPELPDDPAARPFWLRRLSVTWPVRLTEEDSRRNEMYRAERQRNSLRQSTGSLNDYLKDLDQSLTVEEVAPATLARAAQLHLRTNQFNLTTERFDEAALQAMMDDPARHIILIGRALDRFGDHGLSICATGRIDGDAATITSFLMSCRIIGRGVETAFLGTLLDMLKERGVRRVAAAYIPTKKNAMVQSFYASNGFSAAGQDGETSLWERDLIGPTPFAWPEFITVHRD